MRNYIKEILLALTDAERGICSRRWSRLAFCTGVERVTLDLDVAVEMNASNLERLFTRHTGLNLQPRVPVLADIG